jgi:hypothetical protein
MELYHPPVGVNTGPMLAHPPQSGRLLRAYARIARIVSRRNH